MFDTQQKKKAISRRKEVGDDLATHCYQMRVSYMPCFYLPTYNVSCMPCFTCAIRRTNYG